MPIFGQNSLRKLATCHPELQVLFNEVIKYWDCAILEGHRNEADQEIAFRAGNTKLHFPQGKHNSTPSMAVDVVPVPLDWKDIQRFTLFAGYVLGTAEQLRAAGKMTYPVRWGGSWANDKLLTKNQFNDFPHFELRGSK